MAWIEKLGREAEEHEEMERVGTTITGIKVLLKKKKMGLSWLMKF